MQIYLQSGHKSAPGELMLTFRNLSVYYHEGINVLSVNNSTEGKRVLEIHEPTMSDLFRILSRIESDDADLSKFNHDND